MRADTKEFNYYNYKYENQISEIYKNEDREAQVVNKRAEPLIEEFAKVAAEKHDIERDDKDFYMEMAHIRTLSY